MFLSVSKQSDIKYIFTISWVSCNRFIIRTVSVRSAAASRYFLAKGPVQLSSSDDSPGGRSHSSCHWYCGISQADSQSNCHGMVPSTTWHYFRHHRRGLPKASSRELCRCGDQPASRRTWTTRPNLRRTAFGDPQGFPVRLHGLASTNRPNHPFSWWTPSTRSIGSFASPPAGVPHWPGFHSRVAGGC